MICSHCKTDISYKKSTIFNKKPHCLPCATGLRRKRRNKQNREKNEALRSLGLKKVKGALGGTYWE